MRHDLEQELVKLKCRPDNPGIRKLIKQVERRLKYA